MSSVSTTGLTSGSGIDLDTIVSQLIEVERGPERIWQAQQQQLQQQAAILNDLKTKLGSLDTSVDTLKDVLGAFSQNLASSSDESILTATAGTNAAAGEHSVVVTSLATRASYYSDPLANSSTTIASGSFTIKVGTANQVTITVDSSTNTLDKLATHINDLGIGTHASVITDANGARLTLTGNSTGKANDVVLSAVSGFAFTQSSTADNAKLTVDGIPVESITNQVSDVIAGVTISLQNGSAGKAIALNVAPDTGRVTQGVQNFVNSFNTLIKAINTQYSYDPNTQTAGALSGDSSVRSLQQELLSQFRYSTKTNGDLATLSALGVTMENDGTLKLDSSKLNGLLQSNFAGVKGFFQGSNNDGFANSFGKILDGLNDSTKGTLVVDLKGNSDTQTSIARQIDDFEVRIADRRQQLLAEYSRVDALLRQFPLTQSQVTAQLNSLNSK